MTIADVLAQRHAKPSATPRIWIPLGVVIAALAAAPLLGLPVFLQSLVIEVLTFALLSLSLNVLLGYTGLVSFGHAAFFGIAGYAVAAVGTHFTTNLLLTFPLAVLVAALCALPIGWLSIRLSGFYFLMITFAFAQMVYVAAFRWKWLTGGSDGTIVPGANLFGVPVLQSRESCLVI
jgi:branched-chain amino acid transport system permease protein